MFKFGKNWLHYIRTLNNNKIILAQRSLQSFIEYRTFTNKKICDVGSGSGLFSLAARNLGADVVSFDIDAESNACVQYLKKR